MRMVPPGMCGTQRAARETHQVVLPRLHEEIGYRSERPSQPEEQEAVMESGTFRHVSKSLQPCQVLELCLDGTAIVAGERRSGRVLNEGSLPTLDSTPFISQVPFIMMAMMMFVRALSNYGDTNRSIHIAHVIGLGCGKSAGMPELIRRHKYP